MSAYLGAGCGADVLDRSTRATVARLGITTEAARRAFLANPAGWFAAAGEPRCDRVAVLCYVRRTAAHNLPTD